MKLRAMREAKYWRGDGADIICELCPHACRIAEGGTGLCRVRKNVSNRLIAEGYGCITAMQLDPVKKKPLYHFHPNNTILSVGGFGCNLSCPFCQNHELVHSSLRTRGCTPAELAEQAKLYAPKGNVGVAYTYNEPLINYEFVYDCATAVRAVGLQNVLVTNGYINPEPLMALLPLIDAMNIDLKAFGEEFYRRAGGSLAPVKEAITLAHAHCHIEVTTLVIPEENEDDIAPLAEWLAGISKDIPLHISRFFPRYKYADRTATPAETIFRLRDTAKRFLNHVYAGNV